MPGRIPTAQPASQRAPLSLRILIIAGPNGAGKTTFARTYLPNEGGCLNFINADLIAAGLSPFQPEAAAVAAGRIMLSEIARLFGERASFAFETTLAGRGYARQIPRWQAAGYRVELIFLKLRSVRLAQQRVRARVRAGGHSIPPQVIRRRYHAGWENFENLYRALVDRWRLYDNSGSLPILQSEGSRE
jgi:predicted ABC-type ATPase